MSHRKVQLLKDQPLGHGAYGKVCKAKCDGLLCAAKIIHETLFDPAAQQRIELHREHRLPMRRFEQECEFLNTLRHPNIIQYLGICRDPDTHLPVLLMELMDDSLTHFLESSPQPIPYHIQVNICYDITLALTFLHFNGIIHRDLSSNNILLIGNIRAKVTDFGMATLKDQNFLTIRSNTPCPGTDVYMPPEAVKEDKPVYTEKLDCFSFGVIAVQIMTRLFPEPGNRRKEVNVENLGILEKRISERERRHNHISKIDPNNLLLAIALDCLKDKDVERPSAEELCKTVGKLKINQEYNDSIKEIILREHEILTIGVLHFEKISKQHMENLHVLQTESNREIIELWNQLEQGKEEISRLEQQITKLQFHLSEIKSTTLHKLCREGNMTKLRDYVDRIADKVLLGRMLANRRGISGYTPLHEAVVGRKPEVLKYLLSLTGNASMNCVTRTSGYTPLHLAASIGDRKCLQELLAHGADISHVDGYGKTPKQIAKLRSKGDIVKLLHSEG